MSYSAEVPYAHGMDFATGVDTASGSARNTAATGTPTAVAGGGGSVISYQMTEVSSVEDLMTSLNVSASASGGLGLFSASLRMDYAQSCKLHTSSVFLLVSVRVTEAFQSIRDPGITPAAADLVAKGRLDRFHEQFGDAFVRGILLGGQFFGVVEVETRDTEDKRSVSGSLSASYAAFSASGSFDSKFSDTVSTHRTKVTCHIEGGQDLELPTHIDDMTARAVNFPHEVAGHAIPYVALLNDYGVLPLPEAPTFADLQQQKDVLAQCSILRNQRWQWLNDIDYIIDKPEEFVDVDSFPLGTMRDDISADLRTIATAASRALDDPRAARLPETLRITLPRMPARQLTRGAELCPVPNLVGQTLRAATKLLGDNGLLIDEYLPEGPDDHAGEDWRSVLQGLVNENGVTVYHPHDPSELIVTWQNQPAGVKVPAGSAVLCTIQLAGGIPA